MKLGVVGVDSSHLPEFTRRILGMNTDGATACRVTHVFDAGDHGWPVADDVAKWRADATEMGVEEVGSMDALLDAVDGVLVLAVDGARHLELATPSLKKGLPTYVDKPLTCDLGEAKKLLETAGDTPCYSASSLRFITEFEQKPEGLGELQVIEAYGPGELNPGTPGLFHYGVHTIEMVDALWGPGVSKVRCWADDDRHLLDLAYADGRLARLRMERKGAYDFGATVHGTEGVWQYRVDFGPVYTRLVEGMVRFFEGGPAPVELARIVENVAVMEAGNRSAESDGAWIGL